ncbi:MAG: glycoside hydrolase family 125 protein [Sphaerochaetaceae bacterium]
MKHIATGNEFVSLSSIDPEFRILDSFSVLSMSCKGMLDFRGKVLESSIESNGEEQCITGHLNLKNWWIPSGHCQIGKLQITETILCPMGMKGFVVSLSLANQSSEDSQFVLKIQSRIHDVYHCVNLAKRLSGTIETRICSWTDSPVHDFSMGFPVLCTAFLSEGFQWECSSDSGFTGTRPMMLKSGETKSAEIFIGLGYEEIAAATSARHMERIGFECLLDDACRWIKERTFKCADSMLESALNRNLLFCLFYSTGITYDTEEFCLMTSRCPRYYVSAAYWDRDSLFWSFPAILKSDRSIAKKMLEYVFTKQRRNIGIHSRYIDGTVLEPGFELDELCAPVIALKQYENETGDAELGSMENAKAALSEILKMLEEHHDKATGLYSTFLQPTDDVAALPFLTYDNVLVWKVLLRLGRNGEAEQLRSAILAHCIVDGMYAWSVGRNGEHLFYDEPPGSLLQLSELLWCPSDDPAYLKTKANILRKEYKFSFAGMPFGAIGCEHAPHPWILSMATEARLGNEEATRKLVHASMDNGIACESIDETTGECTTGEAFATCAGFVAWSLIKILETVK